MQHIVDGDGRPQIVTNFQLYRHDSLAQMPGQEFSLGMNAFWRYRTLDSLLAAHQSRFSEESMKASNACVSVQQMFKMMGAQNTDSPIAASILSRTLWHSLYNLEERTVAFDFYLGEGDNGHERQEQRSGYISFALHSESLHDSKMELTRLLKHDRLQKPA